MTFIECIEIGVYLLIPLDIIGLLRGAGMQLWAGKKAKSRIGRWLLVILSALGLLGCEIVAQMMTGYDRLVPMILYWCILMVLVGALVCMFVFWRVHKKYS